MHPELIKIRVQIPGQTVTVEVSPTDDSKSVISKIIKNVRHPGSSKNYRLVEIFLTNGRICNEHVLSLKDKPFSFCRRWPHVAVLPDTGSLQNVSGFTFYLLHHTPAASVSQEEASTDCPDISSLSDLSEESLLSTISQRFHNGKIYTNMQAILISVNPYRTMSIYSPRTSSLYIQSNHTDPHIFSMAGRVYRAMLEERRNQSIIISGESGSGKTSCGNYLLYQLKELSKFSEKMSGVENLLMCSTFVLESFGNAKTVHNDNSSRFGKLIRIYYRENGLVDGAKINKYLLEKNRLICSRENNFHVFYYLLGCRDPNLIATMQLSAHPNFGYLSNSGSGDGEKFDELKRAMAKLGINLSLQLEIFWILSAILHIRNISVDVRNNECRVADMGVVRNVSRLLLIDKKDFLRFITEKSLRLKGDLIVSNRTRADSLNTCNAIAVTLYDVVFEEMMLRRINYSLGAGRGRLYSLGILDVYGFEDFEKNGFEQFCINYANECLHLFLNHYFFEAEQDEYRREAISWNTVDYADNQGCIDLFSKRPYGLLHLMEENLMFATHDNHHLIASMAQFHGENPFFSHYSNTKFMIRHYAGSVTYSIDLFREKNTNVSTLSIISFLRKSQLPHLSGSLVINESARRRWKVVKYFVLFYLTCAKHVVLVPVTKRAVPAMVKPKGARRVNSVALQFNKCLRNLMDILEDSNIHFIRCIKSNDDQRPMFFDDAVVLRQLRHTGMLSMIRLRQSGYNHRFTFEQFYNKFVVLFDTRGVPDRVILRNFMEKQQFYYGYQIGATKIFYREDVHLMLTQRVNGKILDGVLIIQKCISSFVTRRQIESRLNGVRLLQKHIRLLQTPRLKLQARKSSLRKISTYDQKNVALVGGDSRWVSLLRKCEAVPSSSRKDRMLMRKAVINMTPDVIIRNASDRSKFGVFLENKINSYNAISDYDRIFISTLTDLSNFLTLQAKGEFLTADEIVGRFGRALESAVEGRSDIQEDFSPSLLNNAFSCLVDEFRKIRKRSLKKKQLVVENHQLCPQNFNVPSYCEVCSSNIKIFEKTFVCKECKIILHKKCLNEERSIPQCIPPKVATYSQPNDRHVPIDRNLEELVDAMILAIESNGGLNTLGLYRRSGSVAQTKLLNERICGDWRSIDFGEYSPLVLTSCLKFLFREVAAPIFSQASYNEMMRAMNPDIELLQITLAKSSLINLRIFNKFMWHIVRIIRAEDNMMNAHSLSTILTPCFIRSHSQLEPSTMIVNIQKEIKCLETLVNEYHSRFNNSYGLFAPLLEEAEKVSGEKLRAVKAEIAKLERSLDVFTVADF